MTLVTNVPSKHNWLKSRRKPAGTLGNLPSTLSVGDHRREKPGRHKAQCRPELWPRTERAHCTSNMRRQKMQVAHAPLTRSASGRPRGGPLPADDGGARRSRGAFPARKLSLSREAPGRPGPAPRPLSSPGPARTHTQRLRAGLSSRPRKPPSTPKAGNATRPGCAPASNPARSTGASARLPRRGPRGAQECERGGGRGSRRSGGRAGGRRSTPVGRGARGLGAGRGQRGVGGAQARG